MKKLVLFLLGLFVCTNLLFSGGGAQGSGQAQSTGRTAAQREAPKLAQQVLAGTLPPLEQRLPVAADIMIEPMESIGAYGDHLTLAHQGRTGQWFYGMIGEEPLFRFTLQGTVEPNVAKGYTVNANATEYTIYLRQGMKWSDGVPFTAADCIFFYEKMILPRTFGNAIYNCYYSTNPVTKERTLCTMEKVNDYEFKVKFADPSPNFLELVAIDTKWLFAPSHYYKTLLPEFIGEAAAAAKARELGFADVAALGRQTGYYHWNNIDRPQLRPWIVSNDVDAELMIMRRNPYYWKTDAEGRQLPYIDELHFIRYAEDNQRVLMVMSGDLDVAPELPYTSIAALKQNERQGGYRLLTWNTLDWSGKGNLLFNQTSEDPKLRSLFANREFRHAISIAADRKEMAALVSDGWAVPRQASPSEEGMGYSKAWAEKWIEYNPQEAKRLLEQNVGLRMGSDGYYTFPDGSRLTLEIMSADSSAENARAAELLTEKYLKNIGLRATFAVRDRAYIDEQTRANKINVVMNSDYDLNTINIALRPDSLVPVRNNFSPWYGAFGTWFATNGESGEAPTGEILRLINLYQEMSAATSKEQINRTALQMLKVHEENLWEIGFLSPTPLLITVNNDLRNFLEKGLWCDEFRSLGIAHPAIFYFAKDKK
ncbi:MAG: ABC transporter substrate-binding protein [Spirochaetaceae bacterium]|jgi:peptide/nickel transport system substrate-binding protein|nr:ABC transporter substrate-binding protein [Spirochaetaceae bacterium]